MASESTGSEDIEMSSGVSLVSGNVSHDPLSEKTSENHLSLELKVVPHPPRDHLLDWDGPDDLGNPKNWTIRKKIFHTALPAFYGFAVAFGTSAYSPAVRLFAEEMHVSVEVATLGISLYSQGLAFGPMIGAPISEARGRKAVYMLTLPIYLLFLVGAGLSKTTTQFLVCRLFAGIFGGPALALGAGTVADIWDLERGGGIAGGLIVQTIFLGPSLGPLVGGYMLQSRGTWQWLMWLTIIFTAPSVPLVLFSSETSKPEILKRRARERGLPEPPRPPLGAAVKSLFVITLFRPLKMLLTEPIVGLISLYNAFAFGVLYGFFTSFPYVFETVYQFNAGHVGLAFLGVTLGTTLALVTFTIFDKTLYQKAKKGLPPGILPPPEHRLYTAMLASFGIPIGLFWFAWTAKSSVHWIVPILASVPFGWGLCAIFVSGITYLVDTYLSDAGASAIAANGLLRYTFGAAFPLFTLQMYENLGIGWATSLLGLISVAMLPIPWVFYYWGPKLRSKSAFSADQFKT